MLRYRLRSQKNAQPEGRYRINIPNCDYCVQQVHLDRESTPSTTEFQDSVSWLDTCLAKNVMDFSSLGSLQVSRVGSDLEISPDTSFCVVPECTGVHHLFTKECLKSTVRNGETMERNCKAL